jgi:hypothetical protein
LASSHIIQKNIYQTVFYIDDHFHLNPGGYLVCAAANHKPTKTKLMAPGTQTKGWAGTGGRREKKNERGSKRKQGNQG